jgi:hypothetical protein
LPPGLSDCVPQHLPAVHRPFIAALAISKARGGLSAPGSFECARRLGRFAGDPNGWDAWSFRAAELNAVSARWGGSRDNYHADIPSTETNPSPTGGLSRRPTNHNSVGRCPAEAIRSSGTTAQSRRSESASGNSTVSAFSPPHDHPHVYINMGEQDTILCPYCATRFRFDPRLRPSEADPPDRVFVDPDLE